MRKHNRTAVVLPAELDVGGRQIYCTAYDLSLGGVRLKVDMPITEEEDVVVTLKDRIREAARVVWSAEGFVGLDFKSPPGAIKTELGTLAAHLN